MMIINIRNYQARFVLEQIGPVTFSTNLAPYHIFGIKNILCVCLSATDNTFKKDLQSRLFGQSYQLLKLYILTMSVLL